MKTRCCGRPLSAAHGSDRLLLTEQKPSCTLPGRQGLGRLRQGSPTRAEIWSRHAGQELWLDRFQGDDYSGSLPDCRAWPQCLSQPGCLPVSDQNEPTNAQAVCKGNSGGSPHVVSQQGEGAARLRLGRGPPCHPGLMQLPEEVVACRQAWYWTG